MDDEVWVSDQGGNQSMRRIIRVYDDFIYYSTGGNTTHACSLEAFNRWTKNTNARLFTEADRK